MIWIKLPQTSPVGSPTTGSHQNIKDSFDMDGTPQEYTSNNCSKPSRHVVSSIVFSSIALVAGRHAPVAA